MLFIFDWDGTLLNSTGRIVKCMGLAARQAQLPVRDDQVYADIIGLGMHEAIAVLYPEITAHQKEQFRLRYADQFIREDLKPSEFFPDAVDTLGELRKRGHRLAVATGKSRRGLDRVMQAHDVFGLFDCTRCADETASKPDPLMLMEILEELGQPSTEAIMIGDSEYDLDMASRAGISSVAVSYGVHSVERLRRHNPKRVIESLLELLD